MIRRSLHVLVLSGCFLAGLIDTFALAPALVNQLAIAGVVALAAYTVPRGGMRLPLGLHVWAIVAWSFLSGVVVADFTANAVLVFLRQLVLLPYLYFLVIVNEPDDRVIRTVRRTILFYVFLQIPAFLIKLAIMGHTEDYVGTVARLEGSMTTLITMIPMAYAFSHYLVYRQLRAVGLVLLFILLSQVGGKRATLVYAPIIMLVLYAAYVRLRGLSLLPLVRGLAAVLLVTAATMYGIVRLNPWLNPDGVVGGRFDAAFTLEFLGLYNFAELDDSRFESYSRMQALPYIAKRQWEAGWVTFLVGEGAGQMTYANPEIPRDVDPAAHITGIRYGSRVAAIWVYVQVGIVGLVLISLFYWRLLREAWRHREAPAHVLAATGMLFVIGLDIYSYSMVTYRFFSIYGMVLAYCGLFYRDRRRGSRVLTLWGPRYPAGQRRTV